MKADTVEVALQTCAGKLGAFEAGVLKSARVFGEFLNTPGVDLRGLRRRPNLSYMHQIPANLEPRRASQDARSPSSMQVHLHLVWMLSQISILGSSKKKCRWLGFIAGALGFLNVGRMSEVASNTEDFEYLARMAWGGDPTSQLIAHSALGYIQGFLWAFGKGSINDFRLINKPKAQPPLPGSLYATM